MPTDVDTGRLELAGSFLIDHPYADTPENRADLAREGAEVGDWTPPEDRANPWGFERALAEMRRRA
jgi:hypothetical protein